MSKKDKNHTPSIEADSTKQDLPEEGSSKAKAPIFSGRIFSVFNLLVSILIIGATGFFGYKGWLQVEHQQSLIQTQQQKLQTILATQSQVSTQVQNQLQQNTLAQNTELTTLKETISAFLKQNQHTRRDWLIAEAEYLIKIANHRLILANDVSTSIHALQAADNRLLEVGNPKFIPLRNALAVDIQKLNAVPKFDIVGISLKLNTLQQQVDSLPLITPDPGTISQRNKTASNVAQADGWQQLPAAIWQDLLSLFNVQHHDDAIQPLLSPEQRYFLVQNLKLQFEQARLALLKGHPVIYQDRIEQAQKWLSTYFDKKQPLTQAVSKTLKSLAATNITQKLPDISNSLTNLQLLHPNNKYLAKKPVAKKTAAKKKITKKKVVRKRSTSRKSKPKKISQKTSNKIDKKTKTTIKTVIKKDADSKKIIKPSSQELNTSGKIEVSPAQSKNEVSKPLPHPQSIDTTIQADKKTKL